MFDFIVIIYYNNIVNNIIVKINKRWRIYNL